MIQLEEKIYSSTYTRNWKFVYKRDFYGLKEGLSINLLIIKTKKQPGFLKETGC
jgi:hypothetical protein